MENLLINRNLPKRMAWVDNVKMVAMLFVIFGHTWRIIHYPLPEWLSFFILSFNMALFVMMTGYTSVHSIDKIVTIHDLINYIEKVSKRILLPSTVFNLLLVLLVILEKIILGEDVSWKHGMLMFILLIVYTLVFLWRRTVYGRKLYAFLCVLAIPLSLRFSNFWFLNMIWCVCVSVSIASYCRKRLMLWGGMLYLMAFIIALVFNYAHDKTSDFIHFFLIGYAISKYSVLIHMKNVFFASSCFILGVFIVWIVGEDGMNFWDFHFKEFLFSNSIYIYFLRILASTLICVFFILLIKKYSKEYSRFSFWGSKVLPLYMVHASLISILYNLPIFYKLDGIYYLIYAVLATFLLTILSIMVIKFFMKYELTQTYCLGEIKK